MILLDTQYCTENMNLKQQCTVNLMKEIPHKIDFIEGENKLEIESCNVFVRKQTLKITWIASSGKEFYKNNKICFKKAIFKVLFKTTFLGQWRKEQNQIANPIAMRTEMLLSWFNSFNNNIV